MPNSVRTQPIWLPTGNPDTTNISPTDWGPTSTNATNGGQPGSIGQKFDYNDRMYQRVQLDSGATSATPSGAPAANDVVYWRDKDQYIVTNDRRFAMNLGAATNAYNNFIAGQLRYAATAGYYVDILQKGDNISFPDGGNSFAAGETVIGELDAVNAVDRIAVGTAPTYQRIGVARGAASGGLVSVDVDLDYEHY